MTVDVLSYPRVTLGEWPTPLQEAKRLSDQIGVRLLIKREDLSGLGAGGNKARKLEFHLAKALEEQATHIVTTGAAQSNHAHLTAAAAKKLGLQASLVLIGDPDLPLASGNLLLDDILDAEITWIDPPDAQADQEDLNDHLRRVGRRIEEQGGKAFLIPEGGTNVLGTLGYFAAIQEVGKQLEQLAPDLKRVLIAAAAGTCGTFAGLVAGALTASFPFEMDVIGISISGKTDIKRKRTVRLVNETLQWVGSSVTAAPEQIWIEDRFIGEGYAKPTREGEEAIRLTAQSEGIFLDPVYTGKAMSAILHLGRTGELSGYDAVIFFHTGGLPLLFHYGLQP